MPTPINREIAQPIISIAPLPTPTNPTPTIAAREVLNAVYRALLAALPLNAKHKATLREVRRLDPATCGVKSTPSTPQDVRKVVKALVAQFGADTLLTVPGFFPGRFGDVELALFGAAMVLPSFDGDHITGLRLRLDTPKKGTGKYIALSSASRNGPGALNRASLALPTDQGAATAPGDVWITEGDFKALYLAQALASAAISVPGVGTWLTSGAVSLALAHIAPHGRVIVAYDSDACFNATVASARDALADALALAGATVFIASWPTDYKGIDDLLIAQADGDIAARYTLAPHVPTSWLPTSHTVTKQYLDASDILAPMATHKVIAIKSPKGTGKTEVLKAVRERVGSMLAIGHRVNLLEGIGARTPLYLYRDKDGCVRESAELRKEKFLAICADSLPKLAGDTAPVYDVVVIDEVEQVLRHITGKTIKQRRNVLNMLKTVIRRAKHVILLDADLSPLAYRFIAALVGSDQVYTLVNDYVATDQATHTPFEHKIDVVAKLLETLASGERAFIATNSLTQAKMLEALIAKRCPSLRGMSITSKNSGLPGQRELLRDPASATLALDYLIGTPSIGTGVDINNGHFVNTFLFGHNGPTTASDLLQHCGRNRKPTAIYSWIDPRVKQAESNPHIWATRARQNHEEAGIELDYDEDSGKRRIDALDESYISLIWAPTRASEESSKANLRVNFYEQARREGHNLQTMIPDSNGHSGLKAACAAIRKAIKEERREGIATAPEISASRAELLESRQGQLTDQEQHALSRHKLEDFTGTYERLKSDYDLDTREVVNLWDKGGYPAKVTRYALLAGLIDPHHLDAREQVNAQKLTPDLQHHTLQLDLLVTLLTLAGIFINGRLDPSVSITNETLQAEFVPYLLAGVARGRVKSLLGVSIPGDVQDNPMVALAAILKTIGIKLERKRSRVKKVKRGKGKGTDQGAATAPGPAPVSDQGDSALPTASDQGAAPGPKTLTKCNIDADSLKRITALAIARAERISETDLSHVSDQGDSDQGTDQGTDQGAIDSSGNSDQGDSDQGTDQGAIMATWREQDSLETVDSALDALGAFLASDVLASVDIDRPTAFFARLAAILDTAPPAYQVRARSRICREQAREQGAA